ncbi:MAG: transposase [Chitinophagales bacterium]
MTSDLKKIYQANNADMGLHLLSNKPSKNGGKKYPPVFKSWRTNWDRLATFYKYPAALKRIIYTTNPIESFHRMVRKVTKTKGSLHQRRRYNQANLLLQPLTQIPNGQEQCLVGTRLEMN